ncbi:helix-turn-helix domain-containing protein [Neolewinella antarctica]|uniref:Transposase n=1 Tax=Neolewinella antarctica TaxID=442734 RepID=A0ABX0XEX8_9BACT|nr:helix-turn-helix domain-containing protein [Neolewinella antarctica]NJC27881.1 transposase [Neolewinella antarctica]
MASRYVTLSADENAALMKGWKTGSKHTFRSRCNMILLSNQGYGMVEIASMEGATRQSVAGWFNWCEAHGIEGLRTGKGQGRPPIVRIDNKKAIDKIEKLVEKYPQKLSQALEQIEKFTGKPMSKKTLKRILKKTAGPGNASAVNQPSGRPKLK